ncbi:hypothetical protein C475_18606 [Halosimplex carlsbadense 2-9-1]|uniref:HTH arsR-type domain-containing protein n=1 Tax=Halosimplex carlsbadense 2-9-1 TaxID=797114 RepID=M0CI65_9EURY|nr:winged helix-turn-helix domain-containing protein [Halosimplex carlsbadense]ELZ21564.1 hypothetical protein C475_18606 [Halosimplex carlsbadense 2-9-1]
MSSETVDWDAVAAIRSSKRRREVVDAIRDDPKYAKEIADQMGIKRDTVSNHLLWLKRNGLAKCLTPERSHHRIYGLTEKGEAAAREA